MESEPTCRACLRPIAAGHFVCQRCNRQEQLGPLMPPAEEHAGEVESLFRKSRIEGLSPFRGRRGVAGAAPSYVQEEVRAWAAA